MPALRLFSNLRIKNAWIVLVIWTVFLLSLSGCFPLVPFAGERALFDLSANFYTDGSCDYSINSTNSSTYGILKRDEQSMHVGSFRGKLVIFDLCFRDSEPVLSVYSDDAGKMFDKLFEGLESSIGYAEGPPEKTTVYPIKSSKRVSEFRVMARIRAIPDFLKQFGLEKYTKYSGGFCGRTIEMQNGTLTYFGDDERRENNIDFTLRGKAKLIPSPC